MEEKKSIRDIMYENIQAEHNEEIKQGNILKELADSKKRQNDYTKDAFLYGANYYTDEKLKQIKKEAEEYLFEVLDINDIKNKITDSTNPNLGELERLVNIENKIVEIKEKRANDCDPFSIKKGYISSKLIDLVDSINGGGSNEN